MTMALVRTAAVPVRRGAMGRGRPAGCGEHGEHGRREPEQRFCVRGGAGVSQSSLQISSPRQVGWQVGCTIARAGGTVARGC